jgi:hypothetical protein
LVIPGAWAGTNLEVTPPPGLEVLPPPPAAEVPPPPPVVPPDDRLKGDEDPAEPPLAAPPAELGAAVPADPATLDPPAAGRLRPESPLPDLVEPPVVFTVVPQADIRMRVPSPAITVFRFTVLSLRPARKGCLDPRTRAGARKLEGQRGHSVVGSHQYSPPRCRPLRQARRWADWSSGPPTPRSAGSRAGARLTPSRPRPRPPAGPAGRCRRPSGRSPRPTSLVPTIPPPAGDSR